jgi:protein tyrosine/serine phosphatase
MSLNPRVVRRSTAVLLAVVSLAASLAAQSPSIGGSQVRIDNFGKISDSYYRGAQPLEDDYADLAALGVHTVIDLTADGRRDESGLVEHAGMKFYRIPMTTTDRPSESAVAAFLQLVRDPVNQPVYVHCQGGRHRTGAMTAVYRMTIDGWTADRAYSEMKQFNFEGFPGHPALKQFVYDYYDQIGRTRIAERPAAATVASR